MPLQYHQHANIHPHHPFSGFNSLNLTMRVHILGFLGEEDTAKRAPISKDFTSAVAEHYQNTDTSSVSVPVWIKWSGGECCPLDPEPTWVKVKLK